MKKFWKKDIKQESLNIDGTSDSSAAGQTATEAGDAAMPKEDINKQQAKDTTTTEQQPAAEAVDLRIVFSKIWKQKKLFAIVLPIVFVLSCLHVFNLPRYYKTDISLAPEIENSSVGGGLSSIASSFGFDLSDMETTDAITPLLYPDLMDDNKFVVDMFGIKVKGSKDSVDCDYYTYLTKHQKYPWYTKPMDKIKSLFKKKQKTGDNTQTDEDPYVLSEQDDDVVNNIRGNISIKVDKKTGVITISATAQDPLICKTLADSVTKRLQAFITHYRTAKAQKDVDYYKHLMEESQRSYEKVRREYAAYSDANMEVVLESVKSNMEDMENDMQLKYNQYTTYNTQYQSAIAKLRERTPAFTMLKGANVPIKPDGPKRMLTVFIFLFMACVVISVYALYKDAKQ